MPRDRFRVVTTCHADGWRKYGRRCMETFERFWSHDIPLTIYAEGFDYLAGDPDSLLMTSARVNAIDMGRAETRALNVLRGFKARHGDKDLAAGRPVPSSRWQAVRWAHTALVAADACLRFADTCDVIIRIDADLVTHEPVTVDWLRGLFPEGPLLAWPDRKTNGAMDYPECGVIMFDTAHTARELVMQTWLGLYEHDTIFEQSGWTDTHALMAALRASGDMRALTCSLSGAGFDTSHPIINGQLGAKFDHLKGERRKERGHSFPHDIRKTRTEPYWRRS